MARGIGENPARSPSWHLQQVEYPASRDDIVETAADSEAPADAINFLKALPKERYGSYEEVLRDFAEAERRFGVGPLAKDQPSRDNLGRTIVEETPGVPTRHP